MDEEEYDEPEPVEIELDKSGLFAWVSEEDRELLKFNWKAKQSGTKKFPHYYAFRKEYIGGHGIEYYLHTEVWERMMGARLPKDFLVDHINGDKLDDRRSNLRLATRTDNEANKPKRRTQSGGAPSSQYKGVSFVPGGREKCWRVTLTYEHKQIRLGAYTTEKEAAEVYNEAAVHYFGEFAYLNKFGEEEEKDYVD